MTQDPITHAIIGCAMEVHKQLGAGFQEVIYQRCLAIELEATGLRFGREIEQPIYYKNAKVGTRRADFIVEGRIVVELKALVALEPVHLAQAKNYVRAYELETGLLINFGGRSLEWNRIFNPTWAPSRRTLSGGGSAAKRRSVV